MGKKNKRGVDIAQLRNKRWPCLHGRRHSLFDGYCMICGKTVQQLAHPDSKGLPPKAERGRNRR